MKYFSYICGAVLITLALCTCSKKIWEKKPRDIKPHYTPFSGFYPLSAPCSDISIGAKWRQNLGLTSAGLSEKDLKTDKGVNLIALRENTELNAGIVPSLGEILGLTATGDLQSAYDFQLKEVELVRVTDIKKLEIQAGSYYVWEGLKVKEFSFVDSLMNETKLEAKVKKDLTESAIVSTDLNKDRKRLLTVTGTDLFVAYRVVEFGIGKPKTLASKDFSNKEQELFVELGNEYSLLFESFAESESCRGRMQVKSYATGTPKEDIYQLWCSPGTNQENRRINIGERDDENGRVMDELILQNLVLLKDLSSRPYLLGKVELIRRFFTIKTLLDPKAPGW